MGKFIDFYETYFSRLSVPKFGVMDAIEILIIAFVIYRLVIWVKKTSAWYLVKGLLLLLVIWVIASICEFNAIMWIFLNTISVGIIAIIVIFQPELRRALEQLGQQSFIGFFGDGRVKERFSDRTRRELVEAVFSMAKVKTGALIILEGNVSLEKYERTGIPLDSIVSAALLINIFEHNTPLHDGAVIVREDRLVAATCILPVSDNMRLSKELGTRHRAGVGVSENADCLTLIVSEETGKVSLAQKGQLIRGVDEEYLNARLLEYQNKTVAQSRLRLRKERAKS
ncbi:MAG: diadenylate cyclase CdaA [Lachnospiraceae bacterium]|nr:diadenylate cyclase CdaA [Lachnospiraceae bacterium]